MSKTSDYKFINIRKLEKILILLETNRNLNDKLKEKINISQRFLKAKAKKMNTNFNKNVIKKFQTNTNTSTNTLNTIKNRANLSTKTKTETETETETKTRTTLMFNIWENYAPNCKTPQINHFINNLPRKD